MWCVIAISCDDCDKQAVGIFNHVPSHEDKEAVREKIGNVRCAKTYTVELASPNQAVEITDEHQEP